MEKQQESEISNQIDPNKKLFCTTHPENEIEKVCLEESCETPLLCKECTSSHPFGHASKTVTLESLTDKEKFLTKMNKKLSKLRENKREEIHIKTKMLKEKMMKQLEESFKALEGKFEETFDQKVDSLLLRDYKDFVKLYEINKSQYHLNLLKDKYRKLIFTDRTESNF